MKKPAPATPKVADLVHLITCLAMFRTLRDPLLNIVSTYLCTVAEKSGKPIEQVIFDEQEPVLGPALQQLSERFMPTLLKSRTIDKAETDIISGFFEHLATIAGDIPKQS